jgi:acetyl esterase/lipase
MRRYTSTAEKRRQYRSPVYRELRGLPPLLVQAAGHDVCHDDGIRLAASARAAGVTVKITEWPAARSA